MDFSKLRLGELIAGVAGVVLLIVMFLAWYGVSGNLGGGLTGALAKQAGVSTSFNAWAVFGFLDILLFLTALAAIAAAVLTATQRSVALPVAASVVITALGVLVTLLVLFRILDQPGPNEFLDVKYGAYLGLLACAAIAAGGFLSMQDEGTSFGQTATDLQGRRSAPGSDTPGGTPPATPPPPASPGGEVPPAAAPGGQPPPPAPPPSGGAPPPV